jgi:hypothetical protein
MRKVNSFCHRFSGRGICCSSTASSKSMAVPANPRLPQRSPLCAGSSTLPCATSPASSRGRPMAGRLWTLPCMQKLYGLYLSCVSPNMCRSSPPIPTTAVQEECLGIKVRFFSSARAWFSSMCARFLPKWYQSNQCGTKAAFSCGRYGLVLCSILDKIMFSCCLLAAID